MELGIGFFAVAVPAALFAGISKGGFGSGAAFASSAILAIYLDPGLALGVMLPLLMLIDLASLRSYWRGWSWPEARNLMLGSVPGVGLGVLFYKSVDADSVRFVIGFVALGFVIWQLSQRAGLVRPFARRLPDVIGVVAGVVVGFTSFVSHAGGPPAAAYLLSQRLAKTTYQSTTVLVFWVVNILKFVPYAFLGMFTTQTALADVVLAPVAVLGAWVGVKLHHRVPEWLFFGITYVLLTITGTKLIWDALI